MANRWYWWEYVLYNQQTQSELTNNGHLCCGQPKKILGLGKHHLLSSAVVCGSMCNVCNHISCVCLCTCGVVYGDGDNSYMCSLLI